MPRMSIIPQNQLSQGAQLILERAQARSGFVPNLLAVMANAPVVLEAYASLSELNSKSSLTPTEREVVQLAAAAVNRCEFCVAGHSAIAARQVKVDPEVVTALRQLKPLPDARLQALAAFTQQMIANRGAVTDEQLQALHSAGFSNRDALEIVLGLSFATLCNFANNLAQTSLNPQLEPYRWAVPSC